jgi:hypothetical protein
MKFFTDAADVTEIRELASTGLLDCVLANSKKRGRKIS